MDKNKAVDKMTEASRAMKHATWDLRDAVVAAYEAGASWAEIGEKLEISKQTAYNRYNKDVAIEESSRKWAAENPEKHAAAVARGVEAAKRDLEEIEKTVEERRKAKREAELEAAKIFDAPAPAPRTTSRQKAVAAEVETIRTQIRENAAKRREEATGNAGPYRTRHAIPNPDTTAQPGIGKGHPHACPNCGSTNHKTEWRDVAEFDAACIPTQYDPPKIAALITFQNHL